MKAISIILLMLTIGINVNAEKSLSEERIIERVMEQAYKYVSVLYDKTEFVVSDELSEAPWWLYGKTIGEDVADELYRLNWTLDLTKYSKTLKSLSKKLNNCQGTPKFILKFSYPLRNMIHCSVGPDSPFGRGHFYLFKYDDNGVINFMEIGQVNFN